MWKSSRPLPDVEEAQVCAPLIRKIVGDIDDAASEIVIVVD
jgi:hypothetical protein